MILIFNSRVQPYVIFSMLAIRSDIFSEVRCSRIGAMIVYGWSFLE